MAWLIAWALVVVPLLLLVAGYWFQGRQEQVCTRKGHVWRVTHRGQHRCRRCGRDFLFRG